MLDVRRIAPEDTHALRQRVLRPHQHLGEMTFVGDTQYNSAHYGVFVDGALISVGTVIPQMPKMYYIRLSDDLRSSWQIRGMATAPEQRGHGYGAAVLSALIGWAAQNGGTFLWCNARSPVLGFYEREGFETRGDEFELPKIGPHYFMARAFVPQDAERLAHLGL